MGWEQTRLEVHARLSKHNSDQDRKDLADWAEFTDRVNAIAREHRYAALDLEVYP